MAPLAKHFVEIYLSNLLVSVGHRNLFRVDELRLAGGEIWGVAGPNGRGKTTLLRLIAGLARPAVGEISTQISEQAPNQHLMYLASIPAILADQSVAQNLEFCANVFGLLPSWLDFEKVLARVGLEGRSGQIVRSLSTGQKRRLSFAALELVRPAILIADEPTNGLDENGRELCAQLLKEAKGRASVVLVATHDQSLLQLCDRVLDLQKLLDAARSEEWNGQMLASGKKRKVTLL